MGAIYLDYGYKKCKIFVEQRFLNFVNLEKIAEYEVNFKSKLIEWFLKNRLEPEFVLVEDILYKFYKHHFITRLLILGIDVCQATGQSKKESQQNAAKIACQLIDYNPNFLSTIIIK